MGGQGWYSPMDLDSNGNMVRVGRYSSNRHSVTDTDIDKALRQGKDPKKVFGLKLSQMSKPDRKKVEDRIRARETKRDQGKK
jgi:hypothetical protein